MIKLIDYLLAQLEQYKRYLLSGDVEHLKQKHAYLMGRRGVEATTGEPVEIIKILPVHYYFPKGPLPAQILVVLQGNGFSALCERGNLMRKYGINPKP